MVTQMAIVARWAKDHTVITLCCTPIYKDANMTKRCFMISVWKKLEAPITIDIPKPPNDAWCDTHLEAEWTRQNNEPLRGGLERGHCFVWQLPNQYTKRNDVIVQYGGDNGVFALLGSHMGRNMMILEKDLTFCVALPNILEAEAECLNNKKDVQEQNIAYFALH
ncbi:hypothetical protein L7F22_044465 [Adiantum nelumboides]|nr:hypothetical protein [Adiantum nelumboides]